MILTLCATGIKRTAVSVESFAAASATMRDFIERHDFGASDLGRACGEVWDGGAEVARVSYNGKVWPPGGYVMGCEPLWPPS